MIKKRCFQELKILDTFEARYQYLRLQGTVGEATFGHERYLNQSFYRSLEWRKAKDKVILRDAGCDLGIRGYEIKTRLLIHHMNPITLDDLDPINPDILNPEFLITTTHNTHQAIHYGDEFLLSNLPPPRRIGDTKLW